MPVRRFDFQPMRKPKKLANGMLRGDAHVTRTGIFVYRLGNGTERRELRTPEEVFKADSLESLKLAPMTLDHPRNGFVDAETAKDLQIGSIGEVGKDGDFVRVEFQITVKDAVDAVEAGQQQELSCGYICDLKETPGFYKGERYDAEQTNISHNHVALVSRGRAGHDCKIKLDSQDALCVDQQRGDDQPQDRKNPMFKITIDGVEYSCEQNNQAAIMAAIQRVVDTKNKATEDAKTARADADKAQARADAAEEAKKTAEAKSSDKAIFDRVSERATLLNVALDVIDDDKIVKKLDSMSDDEIKLTVIKCVSPDADLTGKSKDYISARYDSALEQIENEDDDSEDDEGDESDDDEDDEEDDDVEKRVDSSVAGVRRAVASTRKAKTGARRNDSSDAARQRMIDRNQKMWQEKPQS